MRILNLCIVLLFIVGCKKGTDYTETIQVRKKTIVIGSSIAYGVGASNKSNSWFELLKNDNTKDSFVNFAVSGYTTFHFLPSGSSNYTIKPDTAVNITSVLKHKPDNVIISITTNDIRLGYTPSDYIRNIKVITDSLKSNSMRFIVTSTTLRGDLNQALNDSLFKVAKSLRAIYGSDYVDIMSSIGDTIKLKPIVEYSTTDMVHPNNNGHSKIFERINSRYKTLQ